MISDNNLLKSILLLDDDENLLELYSHLLQDRLNANIVTTKFPSQALKIARDFLFDIILVDVTINYNGSPFGGLEVCKTLVKRYGDSSVIAYSQYITDDLIRQYNLDFHFLEKGKNPISFIDKLVNEMISIRKNQKCFVAMPFDSKYNEIYNVIKSCVENQTYYLVRIDQQIFNKSIIEKIFEEIEKSKIIVFLANDMNPNVFYECGFANALEKEIITITDAYSNLPFDVRDRYSIAYGNDLDGLKKQLNKRIFHLTNPIT